MKNNKLIAEFMGHEILYRPNSNGFIEISDTELCDVDDLQYHTSWDWLMPVVQKIEDYLADNVGKVGYFDECLNSNDLEVRYQAVVEFIKEYSIKEATEDEASDMLYGVDNNQ